MNKVGWSVGAAAATWIGLGYVYRGAEYAAAGPVELETDVMRAILTIAAFFVPMVVGKFNPKLGELLKKLFERFLPDMVSSAPVSSMADELAKLNEIAVHCAESGDEDGVKRCCDLHKHLLESVAKKKVQWDPVQTC